MPLPFGIGAFASRERGHPFRHGHVAGEPRSQWPRGHHGPSREGGFSLDMGLSMPLSTADEAPPHGAVEGMLVRLPFRMITRCQVCSVWAAWIGKMVKDDVIPDRDGCSYVVPYANQSWGKRTRRTMSLRRRPAPCPLAVA